METIKTKLHQAILRSLKSCNYEFKDEIQLSYPNLSSYGDYTTNVAMQVANLEATSPIKIAECLKEKLLSDKFIIKTFSHVEVAKPGFINFFFSLKFLNKEAESILQSKVDYGVSELGKKKKVQIEFISANPTGPLTLGNGRGGFYGDVLGNVLSRVGFKVEKEYLINDGGNQILMLGHSVLKDGEAQYHGEYIDKLNKELGQEKNVMLVGEKAADIILNNIIKKTIEEKMKIKFDHWFSEKKELRNNDKLEKVLKKVKNYLYEKDGALWFKSEELGDNRDRVIKKSDGGLTYLAQDFVYLENKLGERKFDKAIYIWGADHHGDVKGLLNGAEVLGYKGRVEVILTQFVRLIKDGQEVRMSKRAGNYVTMRELIDLVGHDVTRFVFLMYSNSSHMDFDLNIAKKKSEKNPVFNVQYVNARIHSLLNQDEITKKEIKKVSFDLTHNSEISLVSSLLKWPDILEEIALTNRVQLLPNYAMEIADKFHHFYDQCRVISDGNVFVPRVHLLSLTQKIYREILTTIGISIPNNM